MAGEGQAPTPTESAAGRTPREDTVTEQGAPRGSFVSIDLEDIDVEAVAPHVAGGREPLDLDFGPEALSDDALLTLTQGFGASDLVTDVPGKQAARPRRLAPPPLPKGGTPSAPASPSEALAQTRPSTPPLPPPPLSVRERLDDSGSSLRAPPPSIRAPSQSRAGPAKPLSVPPAPTSRRPPPPLPRVEPASLPNVPRAQPDLDHSSVETPAASTLIDQLAARASYLESLEDTVGLSRAYVELAIAHETVGDDAKVNASAEAALKADPNMTAAHSILRRRLHSRAQLVPMLRHLERELASASSESAAIELLAEKARLLEAGDRHDDAREAWERALGRSPQHAAALRGLEADLVRRALKGSADDDAWEDLVAHLGRMSDAFASQPDLAGWLQVERARILELRLGRIDSARGAYERALRLDGSVGPIREAFTLHAAAHHDSARLAALLADEARLEPSSRRCARLELDAACLSHTLLGDLASALELLERAAARAPTTPSVDRRVLDELVRLHETATQWPEAARARRRRLPFFTDAASVVYERRRLASLEERLGHLAAAVTDIRHAMALDPEDVTLVEDLDRLLSASGKDHERIALWHDEAQRSEDPTRRARSLARAAQLAEHLGHPDDALLHLRAAWVASPGDSEVLDHLSRLMQPTPPEGWSGEVRALIDLYVQAAESTRDEGRRIAYLERAAMLWEELAGDSVRAARLYEEILRTEPGRRGAILGLERTASRIGDDHALAAALELEAKLATDGASVLALRARSAQVLARVDPPRALVRLHEVLEHDPHHLAARALETRLHEEAGRWEQATLSLRARIDIAITTRDKVALWLHLAEVQDARLRHPKAAVEALQAARAADPTHPVPAEEIARILEATGDTRALRVATEQLAKDAVTPSERARHLTLAAEIDELRLDDDASAARLYARALAETPDDEWIADRLVRVMARRVMTSHESSAPRRFGTKAWDELLIQLATRIERTTTSTDAQRVSFQLASLLVAADENLPHASRILQSVAESNPGHAGALRLAEAVARRGTSYAPLTRILKIESDQFVDVRARLGALWELASLETWRLPAGESVATYTRILALDPTDPSGLDAAVRISLGAARKGDGSARRVAIVALRSLAALAQDESTRLCTELRLALLLEMQAHATDVRASEGSESSEREALERLRVALTLDPLSVTAATSLARLAQRLGDSGAAAAAAVSLAELSGDPTTRATYFIDAARHLLRAAPDHPADLTTEPSERVAHLLETALESHPDSTTAISFLSRVRIAQQRGELLVDVFRHALSRATHSEAIVLLGSEIARVAHADLGDNAIAIEAMRKVRDAAPDHIASLLTLSELFIAQRAWPEAVETLEDIAARGEEPGPRVRALFVLAGLYEDVLGRPADAEDSLRRALSIEGDNARALRALIHRLAAKQEEPDENGQPQQTATVMLEIAGLLERLAAVEQEPRVKCDIFLELADVRISLNDTNHAEKALVEATAVLPSHPEAFARLSQFFEAAQAPGGVDAVSFARALAAVIGRGKQLGNADARWFASLGHIEVEYLTRLRDGVSHLAHAVSMDPELHESRYELATAYARLGAHDETAKTVMSMIHPTAGLLLAIADPPGAVELLEQALNAERRQEEAIVVSELRAIAGDLDEGRHAWLRARRLANFDSHHAALDRATLIGHVVPVEGRHVLLDIAHAIAGIECKILRTEVSDLGVSSRDRIGKRSGHPTRLLLDRLAKALGIQDVELVITPNVSRTRVLACDALWVVVPQVLTELPEPTQLASLGRALARVALSVPWLEEIPPQHIEALLCAAGRIVNPAFGQDEIDVISLKLVQQYEVTLTKELSRKHRQNLEKIGPLLTANRTFNAPNGTTPRSKGQLLAVDVLIGALARAELRIAYLLTGDMLATIDELRGLDSAFMHATEDPGQTSLGAVLDHPFAGDVVRYALTPEASALRRRVGSTWAG